MLAALCRFSPKRPELLQRSHTITTMRAKQCLGQSGSPAAYSSVARPDDPIPGSGGGLLRPPRCGTNQSAANQAAEQTRLGGEGRAEGGVAKSRIEYEGAARRAERKERTCIHAQFFGVLNGAGSGAASLSLSSRRLDAAQNRAVRKRFSRERERRGRSVLRPLPCPVPVRPGCCV